MTTEECHHCNETIKTNSKHWRVHMKTDCTYVARDYAGPDSQGSFALGPRCRKQYPTAFTVAGFQTTAAFTVVTLRETQALTVSKMDVLSGVEAWLVRVNDMRRERTKAANAASCAAFNARTGMKLSSAGRRHYDAELAGGRKWLRITVGKQVFCFIEAATGDIYKASSLTTPETNFARGSVFVDDVTAAEKTGGHYV